MTAILLTRPRGSDDPLAGVLTGLGYRVLAVPTVATEALPIAEDELTGFDWIIVTSAAGVAALPALPAASRWAAVGEATMEALRRRGVTAEVVPAVSSGAAIAEAIPDPRGLRILLARADAAADDLPNRLRRRGAEVVELAAYRTVAAPAASAGALTAALAEPGLAAVVFASGSAVRGFLRLGGTPLLPAVTIGPRTTIVARRLGFSIAGEAAHQTTRSLAQAVSRAIPPEINANA